MKISFATDHAGFVLRPAIQAYLHAKGYEVIDHGTYDSESVDYPDFAKCADFGILVCSSGIGMSMSANKIKGIRAALVQNEDNATYARKHNDANVICLGAKYVNDQNAVLLIDLFLHTAFEAGRHEARVKKMMYLC
jgi:ribose 5-phosphate isomerase B